jgi:hypothetical protein
MFDDVLPQVQTNTRVHVSTLATARALLFATSSPPYGGQEVIMVQIRRIERLSLTTQTARFCYCYLVP